MFTKGIRRPWRKQASAKKAWRHDFRRDFSSTDGYWSAEYRLLAVIFGKDLPSVHDRYWYLKVPARRDRKWDDPDLMIFRLKRRQRCYT